MNNRDSEFITGMFLKRGYELVELSKDADIILFNTCSVRAHAEERAISNMGHLMHNYNGKIYGIIGCTAQVLGDKLFKRLPGLNIVCGTGEIARLPELVEEAGSRKVLALDGIDAPLPESNPSYRRNAKHAYVSIMRGCNNFCSYCVVPYVRGRERSRRVEDILDEIKSLVQRGIKDITLLGQNVNSYGGVEIASQKKGSGTFSKRRTGKRSHTPFSARNDEGLCNFVELLELINSIDGIEKIGFMTSHPKDATLELFKAIRDLDKLVKHLHLPLQSGSNRILGLMNRGYTRERYSNLAMKAREIIPHLRLTTDLVVGFPTETEKDFNDTLNLMKDIRFDLAYIFKYSPRPGTKATEMRDDVSEEVKKKRHKILLDLQRKTSKRKTDEKTYCLSRS